MMMNHPTTLLIGTRNAGKAREFSEFLKETAWRISTLAEFPSPPLIAETGQTFAENAALKARRYALATGSWALADDSGLEVEALGGAPGILSARYAGEQASDEERIAKLLAELRDVGDHQRRARFVCAIAIAPPLGTAVYLFHGVCAGRIAHEARGSNGFGYDPIFIPDGYEQTFGELDQQIKRTISHRARAFRQASLFLRQIQRA
jgi:XTP/dITP diphosphohydrolase